MSSSMSIATLDSPVRRGPVDLTARWFLAAQLRVAKWFWTIAVVASVLAIAVYALVADQVTTSVVAFGRQAIMWVPFSIFIGLTAPFLALVAVDAAALAAFHETGEGEGAAGLPYSSSDVEVTLFHLRGKVTFADQSSVGVPGDLAGHEYKLRAGGDRHLPEGVDL